MNLSSSLPTLHCPFPSIVVNRAALQLSQANLTIWLRRFPLCSNEQALARYVSSGAAELAAATAPHPLHAEAFQTYTDFLVWLFVLDDTFCDEANPKDRGIYLDVLPHLTVLFDVTRPIAPPDNPFISALADIRDRLFKFGSMRQVARFSDTLREFLLCLVWEGQVRASGVLPDYDSYRNLRRRTAGTLPCIFLSAIVNGADPNDSELAQPDVAAMTLCSIDHVGLANDLFSSAKEKALEAAPLQLPLVLMRKDGLELEEAIRKSANICDDIINDFLQHQLHVKSGASPDLLRYFEVLQSWIRGNIDWSLSCGRYNSWKPKFSN